MNFFFINFQDIAKTHNLILSTRIRNYLVEEKQNSSPLSDFLLTSNKFSLGKIKREEYGESGEFPIIDQSKDFIVGYSDDDELVYNGSLPVVVFGDHTRIFKYVDFPFIQGADGIQVIAPNPEIVNPKFFFYLLTHFSVPSRGYNRHFIILKKQKYPNIERTIQDEAVIKIELIEREIENLQAQIGSPIEMISRVFVREFNFDIERFEELKKQKIFTVTFADIAKHRDLRCGISIVKGGINLRKFIAKNFEYTKLGEILSLEYGNALSDTKRVAGEFPVIGSNGIVGYHDEYIVEAPCIVVGRKGSAGAVNYIEENCFPIDTTFYVQLKDNSIDLIYLTYLLTFLQLSRLTLFKGVPGLNRYDAYDVEVPIVDSILQKKIVEEIQVEFSVQDKIKRQIEDKRKEIDRIIEQVLK